MIFNVRRQRMSYSITALLFATLLSGCTPMVTSYSIEPGGRVTKLGTMTADDDWKQVVAKRIDKEMSGEPAEAGHSTWATYWPWWYTNIRRKPKPAWRSSDFKTSEDMVTYIKQQRARKGLPTYE